MGRIKMCIVTTISLTMDQFFLCSLPRLHEEGFDITLACNMDQSFIEKCPKYVTLYPIEMSRGINIKGSINAIIRLYKLFRKEKFDIVEYATPNATFYASICAWLTRIPVRLLHHCGFLYISYAGIKRFIFKNIEKLASHLSTDVQPVSKSNLEFMRSEGICSIEKSRLVWNGSSSGVNLKKFDISRKNDYNILIREKYGIKQEDFVFGFVGRIGKEKGFDELVSSFRIINKKYPNTWLLFVGNNEKPETVNAECLSWFENSNRVILTGYVDDVEKYCSAMDIFVFPSYHEGFGSAVIEAEAMGIPVIASDIPGPRDGAVENETAIFVEKGAVDPLAAAMERLYSDPDLRNKMSVNARKFVEQNFDFDIFTEKMIENRKQLVSRLL